MQWQAMAMLSRVRTSAEYVVPYVARCGNAHPAAGQGVEQEGTELSGIRGSTSHGRHG